MNKQEPEWIHKVLTLHSRLIKMGKKRGNIYG